MPPAAVVVVPVPPGQLGLLPPFLCSLAQSRAAGDVAVAPGALAVLILTDGPLAPPMPEALAWEYPFALRVEAGMEGVADGARRAAAWARSLGAAGAPVLFARVGRPVEPRWAHQLLSSLRDGADLVMPRRPFWLRLFAGPASPMALSGRAQERVEQWSAENAARRSPVWARRHLPWQRLAATGLRIVAAEGEPRG